MIDDILPYKIISIVGSGGKTTLMYSLAQELSQNGKKVIITTSTKIFFPPAYPVILLQNHTESSPADKERFLLDLSHSLEANAICVTGILCEPHMEDERQKLCSFQASGITASQFLEVADYVLIEADGSKHMPLKFPNLNEPVIPDDSDMIIAVVGLWCIGRPIKEVCHRYELACDFLASEYKRPVDSDHIVTCTDVKKIVCSPSGYKKNIKNRPFKIVAFSDKKIQIDFQLQEGPLQ
ncbi:MAG: selenium cofactor biosynthesis protein YqeC [Proteocatella sp.]